MVLLFLAFAASTWTRGIYSSASLHWWMVLGAHYPPGYHCGNVGVVRLLGERRSSLLQSWRWCYSRCLELIFITGKNNLVYDQLTPVFLADGWLCWVIAGLAWRMGAVVWYSRSRRYVHDVYVGIDIGGGMHSWSVEEALSLVGGVG